jgi:Fe-S-cluster containining protein
VRGLVQIESGDRQLLADIAASMAESAQRSGEWLVCRPGCTQCCLGPFAITPLDAWRLQKGLASLDQTDTARANRVRARAVACLAAIAPDYPGDPATGELWDEDQLPAAMDDLPCPALDPDTGWCDLYAARPITCRTFGPVTRTVSDNLAACELCYAGATDEQMAHCVVEIDVRALESELLAALETAGAGGMTIVAYALLPKGERGIILP